MSSNSVCFQANLQHVDNLSAIGEEGIRQHQLSRVAEVSKLLISHLVKARNYLCEGMPNLCRDT